ncbi:unnamed protein product, partial [Didymodactylos carnosus]
IRPSQPGDEFQHTLRTNYPPPAEPICSSIFQQILSRKQQPSEKFIHYYTDIKKFCYQYDPAMSKEQQLDHLRNGMKITLLDKTSGLDITTTEKLLELVLRYEADQQLIESRTSQTPIDINPILSSTTQMQPPPSTAQFSSFYPSSQYYHNYRQRTPPYSAYQLSSSQSFHRPSNRSNICYRCEQHGHYARGCLKR